MIRITRVLIFASLWMCAFSASAQTAIELTELLGKKPTEVDLNAYLGTDIDTLRSASWRYSAKEKGIMVQAHIDQFDPENVVITTITLYFNKEGYYYFDGNLPFGIRPLKSWNKNRNTLYHKAGFKDLEIVKGIDLGTLLRFKSALNGQYVFISALYLNDEKGVVQKEMYSLQFSILKWGQ